MNYVVGLMFNPDKGQVVLICKARPEWQMGRLNGVGGKIEPNESPLEAMVREFEEETGVKTVQNDWLPGLILRIPNGYVYFFRAYSPYYVSQVKTVTDEMVIPAKVCDINRLSTIDNLKWIIPMLYQQNVRFPVFMEDVPS